MTVAKVVELIDSSPKTWDRSNLYQKNHVVIIDLRYNDLARGKTSASFFLDFNFEKERSTLVSLFVWVERERM
jgi:hypothetical protein